jgi:hypothetical protein
MCVYDHIIVTIAIHLYLLIPELTGGMAIVVMWRLEACFRQLSTASSRCCLHTFFSRSA